ncbi:hypothetical protein [Microcystis aeruginosa]|uniref:hypothetical protein n=1 Tax=Microcystis aeruginosa TaxID=1126 RepID=UPI001303A675|nr:hypothetical protein [Microcystis aeruginosa]
MNSYPLFSYQESVVRRQKALYSPHTPHPTPHTPHPTPHTPLPQSPIPPLPYPLFL